MAKAPSDAALAAAINSPPAPFDLFDFFRAQIERAADDRFTWDQFEARDAFIKKAVEHLTALFRLAEEFAPEQLAELVAYLSWRDVYMVRHEDGAYTLHPTIQ